MTSRTLRFFAAGAGFALLLQTFSFLPVSSAALDSLGLMPPASAKERIRYKPPALRGPIRTAGTGARGCDLEKASPVTLMPLVPDRHIGLTASARPTFYWYAKGAKTVEFALVQPGNVKPLIDAKVPVNSDGIAKLELPASAPDLKVGQEYRWSVAVACNPKRRSEDIAYTQAIIKRVELSAQQQQQLDAAQSAQDKGRIYAEAGLWYNALSTLSQASVSDPANQGVKEDLLSLFDQVSLTNSIAKERKITWAVSSNK
jgi:Domain of Unknown Function (DUF928)